MFPPLLFYFYLFIYLLFCFSPFSSTIRLLAGHYDYSCMMMTFNQAGVWLPVFLLVLDSPGFQTSWKNPVILIWIYRMWDCNSIDARLDGQDRWRRWIGEIVFDTIRDFRLRGRKKCRSSLFEHLRNFIEIVWIIYIHDTYNLLLIIKLKQRSLF